jgi:YVTN family beta-propeller protein
LQYMSNEMNLDDRMRVERKGMEMAYVTDQSQVVVVNRRTREVTVIIPDNMRDLSQVMAISHDAGRSYVISGTEVLVTDMKTEVVIKTITFEVEKQRLSGILMIPGGAQLYVAIGDGNSVAVVDTVTDEVKATIPVGWYPCSMAATSDGARVYVRNYIGRTLSVIDMKTNRVVDTIPVGECEPSEITTATEVTRTMGDNRFPKTAAGMQELDIMDYSRSKHSKKTTSEEKAEELEDLSLLDGRKVAKRQVRMRKIATLTVIVVVIVIAASFTAYWASKKESTRPTIPPLVCNVSVAYVANQGSDTISVINTGTNQIFGTITVGFTPLGVAIGVVVTSDGRQVCATNFDSNSVSVIDTAKNLVQRSFRVNRPTSVSVSFDGTWIYVTGRSGGTNTISVIDTTADRVTSVIPLSVSDTPARMVITPDGIRAYVVYRSQLGRVSVVDIIERLELATIPVGRDSYGIAITPDGTQVYVTNAENHTVSVINTTTNQVNMTILVKGSPFGVAVSPDGKRVYVADNGNILGDNITVIDTFSNMVLRSIPVVLASTRATLDQVAVSIDGTQIYVTGERTNVVYVVDSATYEVMPPISVKPDPIAITTAWIPPC